MRILGIETSCDETAAAVVEDGTKILSNVVASSVKFHQKTGGIIPEVAAREQLKYIIPVIEESVKVSRCQSVKNIDAIAVTVGPGLIGSLLVGVETAKTLAYVWNKPIVPINHLQAHLYANWLATAKTQKGDKKRKEFPQFPAVGLVVSGGHTDLVLMKDHACPPKSKGRRRGRLKWLGGTRDDAGGECFDKTARLLGLGYPGGPAIAAAAAKFKIKKLAARDSFGMEKLKIALPRPMIKTKDFDFSFSGLKTAVINEVKRLKSIKQFNHLTIQQLSSEIQQAIVDVLVEKTIRAAEKYKVKSVLLAGGVAANQLLREQLQSTINNQLSTIKLFVPPPALCTDNATYIASCAYFNYKPIPACPPLAEQKIQANPSLGITGEV